MKKSERKERKDPRRVEARTTAKEKLVFRREQLAKQI